MKYTKNHISHITLIPTVHSEGASLSCLEAMACGNAVIATNAGGLTDIIINGYNGLLIDPQENELFDAVCLLIDNIDLRNTLGSNAIKLVQSFNKNIWITRWENILHKELKEIPMS